MTSWYPTRESPVAGVFVREHAKAAALRNEVMVVHCQSPATTGGLWTLEQELDEDLTEGIPTFRLRHRRVRIPGATFGLSLWAARRATRSLGFRPDVVHAHVFEAGVPAIVAGKSLGAPVVVTEHFTGFPRRTLTRRQRRLASFAFRNAAYVLPVSNQLQQAIEDYGIRGNFQVIPNAVDVELFHPGGSRDETLRRLLFVGVLEPTNRKGLPVLLDALVQTNRQRTDWRLDIVGDGPGRAEHERLVAELGLDEQVAFHGSRTKPEIAEMMRAADLFVLPSLWENLPCVIAEAAASGLPVVATKTGGVPEMVSADTGALVPPGDADALADALGRTLDGLPEFDRAAIARAAEARYSLDAVGAALDAVYAEVAPRRAEG
jgi:glycosyltransferase involved in cell wall biosynthesis